MRLESLIDNDDANVDLKLWKQHFIKQEQNTTGTFDVSEEKYAYSESQEGKIYKNKEGIFKIIKKNGYTLAKR